MQPKVVTNKAGNKIIVVADTPVKLAAATLQVQNDTGPKNPDINSSIDANKRWKDLN